MKKEISPMIFRMSKAAIKSCYNKHLLIQDVFKSMLRKGLGLQKNQTKDERKALMKWLLYLRSENIPVND